VRLNLYCHYIVILFYLPLIDWSKMGHWRVSGISYMWFSCFRNHGGHNERAALFSFVI